MKIDNFYKYIDINDYSATPKYLQIANAITKAISDGKLKKGESVPSLNEFSGEIEISKDTVEKGYKHLKKIGILDSIPGKGYFVKNIELDDYLKILLLFNNFSPHKKIIYDAFVANLPETAAIDFFIYNNDFTVFKKLLTRRIDQYSHYLVMPYFKDGGEKVHEIINTIPKEKLVMIDKMVPDVTGTFSAIYQNFEKDIYFTLKQAIPLMMKYHTIKIVSFEYAIFPKEIVKGFFNFCYQYAFNCLVIENLTNLVINKGDVFITHMENDLVVLIEKILATEFEVGKDIGVISYNESPIKKIILNGITTISTDFQLMGKKAAMAVTKKSIIYEAMPFCLNVRASL